MTAETQLFLRTVLADMLVGCWLLALKALEAPPA